MRLGIVLECLAFKKVSVVCESESSLWISLCQNLKPILQLIYQIFYFSLNLKRGRKEKFQTQLRYELTGSLA